MPRGFTDQEKENIRLRLIQAGHDAFGRFGIKKTNVEELAEKAGISKGAFYGFFPCKEDLYFAVIRHYETGQHEAMTALLSGETEDERVRFKNVIKEIMEQVDRDPFLQRLLGKKELEYLWGKFTPEQLESAMEADRDLASILVEGWKKRNKLKVDDPLLVVGVFRSLFFLYFHKEDIGEDVFPQVLDILLDGAVKKLLRR